MKTEPIIDSSIVGRAVSFESNELFAIYSLVTKLKVLLRNSLLSNMDKESIKQTIGLLSNIIDKNTMDNLLYNPCTDIFTYQGNPVDWTTLEDLATLADQEEEFKYAQ